MRRQLVHGYDTVDPDLLWSTVTEDLPALIPLLERALGERSGRPRSAGRGVGLAHRLWRLKTEPPPRARGGDSIIYNQDMAPVGPV